MQACSLNRLGIIKPSLNFSVCVMEEATSFSGMTVRIKALSGWQKGEGNKATHKIV